MLIFVLHSTSDVGQTSQWTQTPSTTPLQPKKMKCFFLDYVHFWWSARLIDELEPHLPPLSTQKNEMLIFVLHSTSDVGQTSQWTQTPSTTPLHPKKWNASFLDYAQFLMIGRAGWWTQTPSATPLQPIKWNASFWIMFTSDNQPGWLMDSNPICHPSPAKEMKCSFLYYVQLLMISWAGRWTQTPSAIPLQPKKWNAHFCITFKIWCWPDWSMDSNPIHHPCAAKKMKCFFYGLHSTSDDWPGWVMDLNPIHHPSPANKMKCSFLDYIQLLMIGQAGQWSQTPSTTRLQPKKWNPGFCITLNFWWSATWSMDSNPICHRCPANKMKCSFLDYVQLLMISRAVWWTQTPSATPLQPIKWNAHCWITFNFWWSAGLGVQVHRQARLIIRSWT